ncbi:alpha-1,3/alpha-1,6-mannosyltransferase [Cryptococcus neoformans C23]|uniref:Alpha-1,3/1,6-mannosyltransferase ALG2 n=1 Tax=Cryptococcus neoformans (strain H99 / ATCC 208821 / CBS 10515 / FGSC 9487) TaxID=235443 RepID=J9VLR3_CRYN9|nr:alpha-1,3/alpha-1,6-mannosyltransferase [Cryptococcus neoformans var. grubii H99]AUB24969.1 alpha-1,3/alpha-1,6-mannosyltransferase [Cryptococcus neoformans var. grubii]OWZ31798.1 alpha-1,3/alpha-1,6-mannosyltransferase [Cryptococcus neoformans var. grubii AD2-60a]OWZ43873.1 alpha-1,3/alpha-1,6-mannosyltransferase [Cryptococcus neoformans var. grubii C23]OWZ54612.1 alpha-1,3/alpha-1,6-mannosyltransferase [Cryptococcus neoformans var. grubii 125.91]OWZ78562.1 alpha-1,3/alpha-1,6-mannosyltran|eukprot:XP_012049199.1 alpha-1,3/alpha-1,6-mannosyltransferase [Cryptococcus neoformans var. grubii H99]
MSRPLRIGFIHPDLGIGGAERLVVDAALSLKNKGHHVTIFTSRHDPSRCFPETIDGTLPVHVLGSSLPRSFHPKFPLTILFSILRSLLLAVLLLTSLLLPGPPSLVNPLSPLQGFDIFFVDQQSVAVPLLRFVSGTRVVFYCHFPDKLLSGGWEIDVGKDKAVVERKEVGILKRMYRWPIDKLEEYTTGQSDIIISNSEFSSRVFALAFPSLAEQPRRVVYPCIDVSSYTSTSSNAKDESVKLVQSDRPTIISFNRFEAKKNVDLAIRTFAKLRDDDLIPKEEFEKLRFVVGGGYDPDQRDNVQTLLHLQNICTNLFLSHHTIPSSSPVPPNTQIIFLLNFSSAQRAHLLTSPSTLALLYTPTNEHFGIVPIEAGACGLPVLACDTGGPVETIVDFSIPSNAENGTGLLRPPRAEEWAPALTTLLHLSSSQRSLISQSGQTRIAENFSLATMGTQLEKACRDALAMGDLHVQVGDKLIWAGLGLMGFAAGGLGIIWMVWGFE